jgi:predicted glycoside hydrolase/deacetylase ChbG (UPF0249 family)
MKRIRASTLLLLAAVSVTADAQHKAEPLAEALGHPSDARLLIVHADDLGFSHSVNAATIKGFDAGLISSASLMVPCPWFPEIAAYAKSHPEADLGLHLTLTSERTFYRWGPVASKDKVPSLLDAYGYFHQSWTDGTVIDPKEAEVEIRAQIDKAYAMGVRPTHLDSHQYRLFANGKALFETVLRVAREHRLPLLVARNWFAQWPYLEAELGPGDLLIDEALTIAPEVPPEKWAAFYTDALQRLRPGVTELLIHPGHDDEEMRAITRDRETWGAAWRQRDLTFFTSPEFRQLLQEQNIKLITWRELHKAVTERAGADGRRDEAIR